MATARERVVMRVMERIPHPTVDYAFIEVEAGNWNEFEKLREETVTNHPLYQFAAEAPAEPKKKAAAKTPTLTAAQKAKLTGETPVEETVEAADEAGQGQGAPEVDSPADEPKRDASTDPPELTAREKARAKLLEKRKGA